MNKICLFLGHNRFTGVNTWALTLVNELIKFNYEVDVIIENNNSSFGYVNGYDEFIKKIPTNVYCDKSYLDNKYDCAIISYNVHLGILDVPTIFVSHSTKQDISTLVGKVDYHVAVSKLIQECYNTDEVIVNGIDLNYYKKINEPSSIPKNVVLISRYEPDYTLHYACKLLKLNLLHLQYEENIIEHLQYADIVIGAGRSCYEGMSCGKPTLVYNALCKDSSGKLLVDGWIKENNFERLLYRNCSGFGIGNTGEFKQEFYVKDVEDWMHLLTIYNKSDGDENCKLAEKYLSSEVMGYKFNKVIKKLI
tara:strand:- start:393 stop:1313 length:921 start_codon:yes stop_codon:yes gene_type:complete